MMRPPHCLCVAFPWKLPIISAACLADCLQVALERSEQQLKHVTKTIVDAASDHYKLLMQNKQEMDPEKKVRLDRQCYFYDMALS